MAILRDLTKVKLDELTAEEIKRLGEMMEFTPEEVNRYLFPDVTAVEAIPGTNGRGFKVSIDRKTMREILRDEALEILERIQGMDKLSLLRLRDCAKALSKKESAPADTGSTL